MDPRLPYRDRREAGQMLASRLRAYADRPDVLVLALPRGGVPVAYEVATALNASLDVIASGGVRVLNESVVRYVNASAESIDRIASREQQELVRRERTYRGDRPPARVSGRTVILVDDGLATGATMRAAAEALRAQHPGRLIVAVPVAAEATCDEFQVLVDEVVCAVTPEPFQAVGLWYVDFSQTSDEEVRSLLARRREEQTAAAR
jgi:putative phosphoribosyl transferase